MKYYKLIGFLACLTLAASCFLPWAYYPDLHKSFTGFFSEQNMYGKPGKVFVFIAFCSLLLIFIQKKWAKITMIFLAALNIVYLLKTYHLFTSCYNTICPQKQYGLYVLIAACVTLMIVSIFPDLKLQPENGEESLPSSNEGA